MNTIPENQFVREVDEETDFKYLMYRVITAWPWLLFSVLLCLGISIIYIRYQTPMYKISARVLVNDEKKGTDMASGTEMLGGLGGLLGGKSTVDNEAEILKTRYLMEEVVRDLRLNITYYKKGRVKDVELYSAPFLVQIVKLNDTIRSANFEIEILKNNDLSLVFQDLDTIINFDSNINLPEIGTFKILRRNSTLIPREVKYSFTISSIDEKVASLMSNLTIAVTNKQVSVVDLSINHPIPKKGEDILNKLIQNYVDGNLNDKNEVADSTIKFIQNRLTYISNELGELEGNIQSFKQKNNLADMTEQGRLLVENTSQYVNDLAKTETLISITKSLQSYLEDDTKNKRILPSSLIPADLVFNSGIEKYNTLLLERGRKLIGLTENNPIILNLDKEISKARNDIESNIKSTLRGLIITRSKLNMQMESSEAQIQKVPVIERNYLNLVRQQQVKQELYIFLMQKSEETAISKTSNIANSRTIDPPKSDFLPHSPKKTMILMLGIIMGLVIPVGVQYLISLLNNKVSTKEDVKKITSVPILGEISHNDDFNNLAVDNNSRSAISEQFRALRTNLSFYLNNPDKKIILLTSSMSGEGKSFVAINLGNVLAITGKRVLLMELDLRKPGLSSKLNISNHVGFTNFIIDGTLKVDDILKPLELHKNLFLISSGPIPPNPAETLMHNRTKALIDDLSMQFDYIIIDAPPIGIVTDAQLLEEYSDICLYLVRQRFTFKDQLNIVDDLYRSKKMKKLGIVINDINESDSYGYGYGYGNTYNYGSYDVKEDKTWLSKLVKKW